MEETLGLLERPSHVEILLCVISGKDYASSIARFLDKKQPTVTEQLIELKQINLIKPLKRRKAQRYEVNWNLLLEIFYETVYDVLINREEYLRGIELAEIKPIHMPLIIPQELIKAFLKGYLPTLKDVGGKRKSFDELIFSFFCAMNNLDKHDWNKIVKQFDINEKKFSSIANAMEFEIYGVELVVLQTLDLL